MEKREWLLLSIGESMEPIQIQKTLFKFAMESKAASTELYSFIPYNWGPCSMEIYDDLSGLRDENLVEFAPSGRGWNIYHLTKEGAKKATDLRKSANRKLVKNIDSIHEYVVNRDFETLLSDIYSDYPDYAKESLFEV
ncbi:unnamed protein product [marine sediment metagenome]|uniref:Transcription regulator PadR N-terminal domain-containing protein n=1 Tax=marine sediment metagenome TaxID=412755 RepID=X1HZ07_9ZZZZ